MKDNISHFIFKYIIYYEDNLFFIYNVYFESKQQIFKNYPLFYQILTNLIKFSKRKVLNIKYFLVLRPLNIHNPLKNCDSDYYIMPLMTYIYIRQGNKLFLFFMLLVEFDIIHLFSSSNPSNFDLLFLFLVLL